VRLASREPELIFRISATSPGALEDDANLDRMPGSGIIDFVVGIKINEAHQAPAGKLLIRLFCFR